MYSHLINAFSFRALRPNLLQEQPAASVPPTAAPNPEGGVPSLPPQLPRLPPPPFPTLPLPPSNEAMSIFVTEGEPPAPETDVNNTGSQGLPAALAPLSPSPEQGAVATTQRDVVMRSENASPQNNQESVIRLMSTVLKNIF